MARVVVVGLGPAGPELVTAATLAAIEDIPHRFLRTARHPSAGLVADATTFDGVYEGATILDAVYPEIVERLVAAAAEHGEVLYAVPGSPLVAERTVDLLRGDDRVKVEVHPALSYLDLAWAALGVDPLAAGVRLVDGHRFTVEAAGQRGPLLVAQCDSITVLSEVKLSVEGESPASVTVLQRLGLPDASVHTVAWDDLDRVVIPDHLTTLWIPELAEPIASEMIRLHELVRTLRARCPWDQEQTHASLTRHLLEESYEVLEAIDALDVESGEGYEHLEEELGDLLYQIEFHALLAAEQGRFTMADVARNVHDKLVARHPHVFGGEVAHSASEVVAGWEQRKQVEKGRDSILDGIPTALPGLLLAWKVQGRAASVGFDWPSIDGPIAKVAEELAELVEAIGPDPRSADPEAVLDELGDLLFSVVNVARQLDVDPESALRRASASFTGRFRKVERLAAERGLDVRSLDLAGLDALWDEAKATERPA